MASVKGDLATSKKSRKKRGEKKLEEHNISANASGNLSFLTSSGNGKAALRRTVNPKAAAQADMNKIMNFLTERSSAGEGPISVEDCEKKLSIEIASNELLLKLLEKAARVNFEDNLLSYNPETAAGNEVQFMAELKKRMFISQNELKGAYEGIKKDIKELKENEVIDVFDGKRKDKIIFYLDPEYRDKSVAQVFKEIWYGSQISTNEDNREAEIRKYGGKPFMKKPELKNKDDEEDAPKKVSRTRAPKNDINAHMRME